ncbi:divisome protein SepX/GlpR [Aeromicrobium sp.]|uniref:divisome protein SepX/GlpR n=1 Tax=Aeromicrobium sp. TaxID=1871063 RepID=UPI002FCA38B7
MGSSSGLIIAFVVAVWAAYFVPLMLRRYDEHSKNASVETSGSQSRVIARPSAKPATMAAEATTPVVEPVIAKVTAPAARTLDRPAARLAARRRRRTLLTLLAATAVVGGLAGASVIAPFWVAAPVALVVAWLVACRIQVRSELGLTRVKAPKRPKAEKKKAEKKAEWPARDEEETIVVSGHFEDINPGRKNLMEDVPLEANALDDQIVIAVPSVSTTGEALWDPLPVTLPTYVTKPRAGRTVRTIDFGQAGAWTSGHIEGEDVELPKRSDDTGDERRAVGH